jgi:hypothetical protein
VLRDLRLRVGVPNNSAEERTVEDTNEPKSTDSCASEPVESPPGCPVCGEAPSRLEAAGFGAGLVG